MENPKPTEATCLKSLTVPFYLNLGTMASLLQNSLSKLDQHLPLIWKEALHLSQQNPSHNLSLLADLLSEHNPCLYPEGKQKIYWEGLKRLLAAYLLGRSPENNQQGLPKPQGQYFTMRTYAGLYFLNDSNWEDGLDLLMFYSYITQ